MSVAKSRKCYLCGISGHISAECPTPNAKQAKSSSSSSSLTSPSSSVAAFTLPATSAAVEKVKAKPVEKAEDVSSSSLSFLSSPSPVTSRKCYNCGQTGHLSSLCPSANNNSRDGSSSSKSVKATHQKTETSIQAAAAAATPTTAAADSGTTDILPTSRKCYVCGVAGHLSSACPTKAQTPNTNKSSNNNNNTASLNSSNSNSGNKRCTNCGINGHVESECPLNLKPTQCAKCNKHHLSIVCPKVEPISAAAAASSSTSTASTAPASAAAKTRKCYNCGLVGHMSSACPSKKAEEKTSTNSTSTSGKEESSSSNEQEGDVNNDNNNAAFGSFSGSFKRKAEEDADSDRRCQMCKETGHVARNCPNKEEKQACYNCGGKDHFAKECPEEKKQDERVCHECGEQGHITRACPKKKKYRKKDSGKEVCFVCEQTDGHFAKNCPSLIELKTSFELFLTKYNEEKKMEQEKKELSEEERKISIDECVKLLELCSRAMEVNGCVFLYNYLLERKVALTEHIYDLLFRVYDRIGLAHSVLPPLPKTGSGNEWPRDQLRRIVKSRQVGNMNAAAGENLPSILQFLEANPKGSFENVFKLATFVAKGCNIGNKQARTAVLLLHSQGALAGVGVTFKKKSKQPPGEEELLRTALQKEFPDKQEKWNEWLSVLQAQDLITLRDLRELDVKDLDSLPVSAALRSGLRRLQAKPLSEKPVPEKRKLESNANGVAKKSAGSAKKSKKKPKKSVPPATA